MALTFGLTPTRLFDGTSKNNRTVFSVCDFEKFRPWTFFFTKTDNAAYRYPRFQLLTRSKMAARRHAAREFRFLEVPSCARPNRLVGTALETCSMYVNGANCRTCGRYPVPDGLPISFGSIAACRGRRLLHCSTFGFRPLIL